MDEVTERVPGCVGIADDLIVYGETDEDHDRHLIDLMETSVKEGLVFNSSKCQIKVDKVEFFGSVYSADGISPDPEKIVAITNMATPNDKDELQRFIGMMTYLSSHIPNFSHKVAPLRELLKKDVPFDWQEDHQKIFNELKDLSTVNLQYYNPQLTTVLETDASSKGLGACLLQEGKPVAFASKSLSEAETRYSNIERETLALVFRITRFHTYLFGTKFTVHSDHKPLEMICHKPLGSAPPRLQRLLVKVQGYDFDVVYKT